MNKGINFEGKYRIIDTSTTEAFGDNYTIECWVNLNSYTQKDYAAIIIRGNGTSANGIHFHSGKLALRINSGEGLGHELCNIKDLPLQKWFHISLSQSGKEAKFYINGNLAKTLTGLGIPLTQSPISIGDWSNKYGTYLDASLTELRVWRHALTDKEVKSNMKKRVKDNHNLMYRWELSTPVTEGMPITVGTTNIGVFKDFLLLIKKDGDIGYFEHGEFISVGSDNVTCEHFALSTWKDIGVLNSGDYDFTHPMTTNAPQKQYSGVINFNDEGLKNVKKIDVREVEIDG